MYVAYLTSCDPYKNVSGLDLAFCVWIYTHTHFTFALKITPRNQNVRKPATLNLYSSDKHTGRLRI